MKKAASTFGGLSQSELMSRVRSAGNVSTEIRLIDLLKRHKLSGWRRSSKLIGKPDFVWASARLALFVDGCFWHGHTCPRNLKPRTNQNYWQQKIRRNILRDRKVARKLRAEGWNVIRIWECALARHPSRCLLRIQKALSKS
jgi:DNA mismatch endonuclease (patch repair protein)